jgi:hypothetical protein
MQPTSDDKQVRLVSDAETTKTPREACANISLKWTEDKSEVPGLGFGGAVTETTVLIGALSAVVTGVCAVLRTALKERKRIVIVESRGKKYRSENIDDGEIEKILAAANHPVEVRLV